MNVLFGLIENVEDALIISQRLFDAITLGKTKESRELQGKLTALLCSDAIYVSEDEWFGFLKELRQKDGNFQADYVLHGEQIKFLHDNKSIFPEALNLMIDKALKQNCAILELPVTEGEE